VTGKETSINKLEEEGYQLGQADWITGGRGCSGGKVNTDETTQNRLVRDWGLSSDGHVVVGMCSSKKNGMRSNRKRESRGGSAGETGGEDCVGRSPADYYRPVLSDMGTHMNDMRRKRGKGGDYAGQGETSQLTWKTLRAMCPSREVSILPGGGGRRCRRKSGRKVEAAKTSSTLPASQTSEGADLRRIGCP